MPKGAFPLNSPGVSSCPRAPPVVGMAARAAHDETFGGNSSGPRIPTAQIHHPVLEDAVPFLEALLTGVPGNQFLEIRTIAKRGASHKKFYLVDSLRDQGIATALPLCLDGRENIYYGVAPRYEKREAKADDDHGDAVNLATAIWFDEITKAPPVLPPFSWIVETSFNKVQGGYLLTAPTADLDRVERLNKRLGAAVGGDNVWNRGRILRLPGFINAKYEGEQRSYLVEFHPERRYNLEELERLLPPLPAREAEDVPGRNYVGPFNPHHGESLPDDAKERFLDYLKGLGLARNADGRYRGPCPFPHEAGPSDGESAFYVSPISGTWHCFGSSHVGERHGGVQAFRPLGFRVQLPEYIPDPEATRKLFAIKRGRPPENKQGKEPTPDCDHYYQGYVDDCWPIHQQRRKAALKQGKPDRLTGELRRHLSYLTANTRTGDAELAPIFLTNKHGGQFCIAMEHPHLATRDLEPLAVGWLGECNKDGEINPVIQSLRECGRSCRWVCDEHGSKMTGQAECRKGWCPWCLTDLSKDLDRARLPDLDPETGEAYRSVWITGRYPLPSDLAQWKPYLTALHGTWQSILVKIQRQKATRGSVMWRSFTAYYAPGEAWIRWKVMFKEDSPGAADDSIVRLCQEMTAEVYDDRRFVHGELASFQLVENSRTHLLGFSPELSWDDKLMLWGTHYEATSGKKGHVCQPLGMLRDLLAKAPKPQPLVCDECGAKLRQVLDKEGDSPGLREETTVGNPLYGRSPPDRDYGSVAGADAPRPVFEGEVWEVVI
jgi:hypothetical protein